MRVLLFFVCLFFLLAGRSETAPARVAEKTTCTIKKADATNSVSNFVADLAEEEDDDDKAFARKNSLVSQVHPYPFSTAILNDRITSYSHLTCKYITQRALRI